MLNVFNEFNQWTKPIVQQDSMLDWIKSLSPTRDKSSGKQLETVSELEPYLAHYITLKKHEQGIRVRRIGRVGDEPSPSRRASRRDWPGPRFFTISGPTRPRPNTTQVDSVKSAPNQDLRSLKAKKKWKFSQWLRLRAPPSWFALSSATAANEVTFSPSDPSRSLQSLSPPI